MTCPASTRRTLSPTLIAIRFIASACALGDKSHGSGCRRRDVSLGSTSEGSGQCSVVKRLKSPIQYSFSLSQLIARLSLTSKVVTINTHLTRVRHDHFCELDASNVWVHHRRNRAPSFHDSIDF